MGKKLSALVKLIEIIRKGREDNPDLIGRCIDNAYLKSPVFPKENQEYEKDPELAAELRGELEKGIRSGDEDLRTNCMNVVEYMVHADMLPLIEIGIRERGDGESTYNFVAYILGALQSLVDKSSEEKEHGAMNAAMELLIEMPPGEVSNIISWDDNLAECVFSPIAKTLGVCEERKVVNALVDWLMELAREHVIQHNILISNSDEAIGTIEELQKIENPLFYERVRKYLKGKDKIAKSVAFAIFAQPNYWKELRPFLIKAWAELEKIDSWENMGRGEDAIFTVVMALLQWDYGEIVDSSLLDVLIRVSRMADANLKKEKIGKDEKDWNDVLGQTGAQAIERMWKGAVRIGVKEEFDEEIQELAARDLGKAFKELPAEYTLYLMLNSRLFEFAKTWDAKDFFKDSEPGGRIKFPNKIKLDDAEEYYAEYGADGRIVKSYKDIKSWKYGLRSDEFFMIENGAGKTCIAIKSLLGDLGITGESSKRIDRAEIFKDRYKTQIEEIARFAATAQGCGNFLNELLHWVPVSSTRVRSRIVGIMEDIQITQINRPFRVEICNRYVAGGALGYSKEAGACIFPGGREEEWIVNNMENRAVSLLDYFTEYEGDDIRANRATLCKTRVMRKMRIGGLLLGKGLPVLLVDAVDGMLSGLPFSVQYKAILDYAKDRGYPYVMFNSNVENANEVNFMRYVRGRHEKSKGDIIEAIIPLELLEPDCKLYTNSWGRDKKPRGSVIGYLQRLF